MINKSRGAALIAFALVLSLIPFSANSNSHGAGPQTPPCGIYKVKKDEVIAGVKFPKGSYQINAFGISCSKVLGSKGLFAQFLKLKDKDPLPKPWKYLAEAVGAPKFSSGPGVGFRVQLLTPTPTPTTPTPTPTAQTTDLQNVPCPKEGEIVSTAFGFFRCEKRSDTGLNLWNKSQVSPTPTPTTEKINFVPWSSTFVTEDMIKAAIQKTDEYLGTVKPSNSYSFTVDPAITDSDRAWITQVLDYTNGAFSDVLQGRVKVFLGTTHQWSASAMRSAGVWVGDPRAPFPCSSGINDAYCAGEDIALMTYSDIYKPNSDYRWDIGRRSTPAHELFHNVQFALNGANLAPNNPTYIPRWLMEGSANYFGFYIVDKLKFGNYETGRRQQVNTNQNYRSIVPLVQYDNFASDPYGIGQAASEYLIASAGFENFLNIWRYTKSEGSFEQGFRKAVGIEISVFYDKFEAARGSMKIGTE